MMGSIALWAIGISQDYLKGVMEHNMEMRRAAELRTIACSN